MRRRRPGGIGKPPPVDDLESQILNGQCSLEALGAAKLRRARINVADFLATGQPHELDGSDPRLAGREVAANPILAAELLELLDELGLHAAAGGAS